MSTSSSLVKKALVVGGGIGGMSTAIALRKLGIEVLLIDLDPKWRVYGAGITITGATLRAFDGLGILPEVLAQAYTGEGIQICDQSGQYLRVVPTTPVEPHLPGCGGIMRPLLHKILSSHTLKAGTQVRLGVTVDEIRSEADGAHVRFSDGVVDKFDLVVGADGIFSRVRQLLFPQAPKPEYTGQCVWRIVVPRPKEVMRRHFFLGGPVKVGLTPVSEDQMYMFLLETVPRRDILNDQQLRQVLAQLLQGYGGLLDGILDRMIPGSDIVLRPLEGFLMPAPWHSGRSLIIGDAAHPTTPQLASGAGMAVEDALILAQEIERASSIDDLFKNFMQRRYERCKLVVENSLEIGRREQRRAPIQEQTQLVEDSLKVLAQAI